MPAPKNTDASNTSNEPIQKRLVRFDEMIPCKTAFIDARTPGSDKKENFCLIGQGVAENPDQVVHIDIPHGFNIGAARQPNGCKNSHHSHDTEEVFMIFSGEWKFTWGQNGEDGETILTAGDTISLPRHMFRGFENIGDDGAFMFSILGLDQSGTAGHVLWAPYVFKEAKKHGLVLLEDGRLIDTAAGIDIPKDSIEQAATTPEQAAALSTLSATEMAKCVSKQDDLDQLAEGGLSSEKGVRELAIIGQKNSRESIGAGRMAWQHGFVLRRFLVEPQTSIADHFRAEEEVIIVQSGELHASIEGFEIKLCAGDMLTIPIGHTRSFRNMHTALADMFVVRRGDHPLPAQFVNTG